MKAKHTFTPFWNIVVPVVRGAQSDSAIAFSRALGGTIGLAGLVRIPEGVSLSSGALPARQVRYRMRALADGTSVKARGRVRVAHQPWHDLRPSLHDDPPDLLVLEWPAFFECLGLQPADVLDHPVSDVAMVRGPWPAGTPRILVALRGGPYAELILRIGLALPRASLLVLHVVPENVPSPELPFRGLANILARMPEVSLETVVSPDPAATILERANGADLLVIGASALPPQAEAAIGLVASRIVREAPCAIVIAKSRHAVPLPPAELAGERAGAHAISVLVDKWFAENSFHADEFDDLDQLVELKRRQGLTISLVLPTLNEEATVGKIIRTLRRALMEKAALLDEIVLIDSESTDRTREIAERLGISVYLHPHVLSRHGARPGKGEALWKSMHVTRGDLLAWIDTDIVNIHPRFVYGLLGPLLTSPRIQYVKGFYRRPLRVGNKTLAGAGGRVTELTARPLLNLLYPELSGLVQPLSGEFAGRRSALETLPFASGFGVETGLLIDILDKFSLRSLAQVDLLERIHRNKDLEALSKTSFAVIQVLMRRLERRMGHTLLEEVNTTMKLVRHSDRGLFLEVEEIAELERPPMIEIPEYRSVRRRATPAK
ncbi:MAG TPA: glucosyl-3-phosphoglycerate synthase [Anaerolineales bacterium]|nr:glucosyl-3-phosphoglycerate synthase [Anaerolineales bacterium]